MMITAVEHIDIR